MSEKNSLAQVRGIGPFGLMRQLNAEFDRVVGAWPSFPVFGREPELAWMPKIDVVEKDNVLVTRIDLPGLKQEDVSVELTDGCLAIAGERKHEAEDKKEGVVVRRECEYGSFYRSVPLPAGGRGTT